MSSEVSNRLRVLRDRNNWTVADMAERTGIPKRTLDKYMLRQGASLPGLEALCALSRGLGVSLDWLVFGAPSANEHIELIADRAADHVVSLLADILLRWHREGKADLIAGERILNLSPEELAADLGLRAAEKASSLLAEGTTKEDLLRWRAARAERLTEILRDRFDELAKQKTPGVEKGSGN